MKVGHQVRRADAARKGGDRTPRAALRHRFGPKLMFFMEEIRHPMQGREFKLKRTKFKVGGISTPLSRFS